MRRPRCLRPSLCRGPTPCRFRAPGARHPRLRALRYRHRAPSIRTRGLRRARPGSAAPAAPGAAPGRRPRPLRAPVGAATGAPLRRGSSRPASAAPPPAPRQGRPLRSRRNLSCSPNCGEPRRRPRCTWQGRRRRQPASLRRSTAADGRPAAADGRPSPPPRMAAPPPRARRRQDGCAAAPANGGPAAPDGCATAASGSAGGGQEVPAGRSMLIVNRPDPQGSGRRRP